MDMAAPVNLERLLFQRPVGARLVELRRAVGYGDHGQAKQFAATLGVRQNHYSMMEAGKRPVPPELAVEIRRLFGATLDWLYTGDESGLPDRLRRALHAPITET
jgi:transcriptional regulator with XRE-family HTH domain